MQRHDMDLLHGMTILIIIKSSYAFVGCNLLDSVLNKKHVENNLNMEHHTIFVQVTPPKPTSQRRHDTSCCITNYRDQHLVNGLTFMPVYDTGSNFFLFFCKQVT